MNSNQQVADGRGPSLRRRSLGIIIVVAVYGAQLISLNAFRGPLSHSLLLTIIAPIILGVGCLSSGLILGGMVLDRSFGGWRFFYGLVVALFLSFLLIVGIIEFLNSLPPTYDGP